MAAQVDAAPTTLAPGYGHEEYKDDDRFQNGEQLRKRPAKVAKQPATQPATRAAMKPATTEEERAKKTEMALLWRPARKSETLRHEEDVDQLGS